MPGPGVCALLVFAATVTTAPPKVIVEPQMLPLIEVTFELESSTFIQGLEAQRTGKPPQPYLTKEFVERTIAQNLAFAAHKEYGYLRWRGTSLKAKPEAGTVMRIHVKLKEDTPRQGRSVSDYYLQYFQAGSPKQLAIGLSAPIFKSEDPKPIYNAKGPLGLDEQVVKRFKSDMTSSALFEASFVRPHALCHCPPAVDKDVAALVIPFSWDDFHAKDTTKLHLEFFTKDPDLKNRSVRGEMVITGLYSSEEYTATKTLVPAANEIPKYKYRDKTTYTWDELEAKLHKTRLERAIMTMQSYVPSDAWVASVTP